MLNINNFKALLSSLKGEDTKGIVYFGNDTDISYTTNRCKEDVGDINLCKVLKEFILEYFNNYGILENEILEYHKVFHLKGWKKEEGSCTQYLLEINPVFRIYFFCDSNRICRRIRFLYKRE